MPDSAITSNRLSERMAATAARLTTVSRRLTAAHGLNGFTIEELCDEVGVSRRTFFNYFPGKEDAVLGIDESEEVERIAEEFLRLGSRGWPAVLDDFVDITAAYAEQIGLGAAEHADFHAALEREPKLLIRFMGLSREREQSITALIAQREGVPVDDPRARACVDLFGLAMKTTMARILGATGTSTASGEAGTAVADIDLATTVREALVAFAAVLPPLSPAPPSTSDSAPPTDSPAHATTHRKDRP